MHLLLGSVDEAPLVVEVVLDGLVFEEVLREGDDVMVAAAGEQQQVLEGIEALSATISFPVNEKEASRSFMLVLSGIPPGYSLESTGWQVPMS